MPNKKISQLNPITGAELSASDLIPVVDVSNTETKKITYAQLLAALSQPPEEQWFTLDAGDIAAKQISLTETPPVGAKVLVDWQGAGPQEDGVDYLLTGTVLDWDGYALEGQLEDGSKIRVFWLTVPLTVHEEWFTLDAGNISDKFITLENTPPDGSRVQIDWQGAGPQKNGVDFLITGDVLSWDGYALDTELEEGSKIRAFWVG